MSDEKQDEKSDIRSGEASAVMRALRNSNVLKRKLSRKARSRYLTPSLPLVVNPGQ